MSDQPQDVIDILVQDHREVEEMFRQYEGLRAREANGESLADQRRTLVDKMIIELVRHSVAEEQYVYPAAKEKIPNSEGLVDEGESEHSEAERTMNQLDKTSPDDAEFDAQVSTLMAEIRHHVEEEEGELFPLMRQHIDADELRELGGKVETAKKVAPTRPHPMSPDNATASKLLDPGAGIVDRLRDALTGRGKD